MSNTEEDVALPASTPQVEASRSCTRQMSCKKANCPIYSKPIPGTHHVRNLTQELETIPPPKKISKPPAPLHHRPSTSLPRQWPRRYKNYTRPCGPPFNKLTRPLQIWPLQTNPKPWQLPASILNPNPNLLLLLLPILSSIQPTSKPSAWKCPELNSPNGVG